MQWRLALTTFPLLVFLAFSPSSAQSTNDERVREALLPLPEAQRSAATVVEYDTEGERRVLRQGTNDWICVADSPEPGFRVGCHHQSLDDFAHIAYELAAQARGDERNTVRQREYEAGNLQLPEVAIEYVLRGRSLENALPVTLIRIPFATAESTGLPTEPQFRRPWLMGAGKIQAHIMLPGS